MIAAAETGTPSRCGLVAISPLQHASWHFLSFVWGGAFISDKSEVRDYRAESAESAYTLYAPLIGGIPRSRVFGSDLYENYSPIGA